MFGCVIIICVGVIRPWKRETLFYRRTDLPSRVGRLGYFFFLSGGKNDSPKKILKPLKNLLYFFVCLFCFVLFFFLRKKVWKNIFSYFQKFATNFLWLWYKWLILHGFTFSKLKNKILPKWKIWVSQAPPSKKNRVFFGGFHFSWPHALEIGRQNHALFVRLHCMMKSAAGILIVRTHVVSHLHRRRRRHSKISIFWLLFWFNSTATLNCNFTSNLPTFLIMPTLSENRVLKSVLYFESCRVLKRIIKGSAKGKYGSTMPVKHSFLEFTEPEFYI